MGGASQTQKSTQKQKNQTSASPYDPAKSGIDSILKEAQGVQPFDFSGIMPGMQESIGALSQGQLPPELLSSIENSARNTVGDVFAKGGRSFSGAHVNALTNQLTNSIAPYAFQGMSMVPGLSQAAAGMPYSGLQQRSNLMLPIASAFGSTQGKSNMTGTATTEQSSDPFQMALGGGLGLLGLGLSPYNPAGNTLLGGLFK